MVIKTILQNETTVSDVPAENHFQAWVDCALHHAELTPEETIEEVFINIVSLEKSALLNEEFRNKVGPTNVLAFTYDPIPGIPEESLGDLAICADIVAKEALEQQKPFIAHWAHLTIHGTLHLLGYDHINEKDAQIMEALEVKALHSLGFDNPYETNG